MSDKQRSLVRTARRWRTSFTSDGEEDIGQAEAANDAEFETAKAKVLAEES